MTFYRPNSRRPGGGGVPTGGTGIPDGKGPSRLDVLWGWVSDPIRIMKFIIGSVLIIGALYMAFKDNPNVQKAQQLIIGIANPAAGAATAAASTVRGTP